MNPIEKRLEALGFNGIAANFRLIMALAPPRLGAYRRILDDLDGSLHMTPGSARLHALKGKALSNLGRYPEACSELQRSIFLDGSWALPHAWLGEAHLMESRVVKAVEELERALKLDPKCAWAYFYRSAARYIMGGTAQAGEDLRRILEMGVDGEAQAAAGAFLSLLEAKEGRFEPAMARIKEVLGLCPGQTWPYALRAAVHRLSGNKRAALKDINAALAGRAEGWVYLERASLKEEGCDWEGALKDIESARKLQGGSSQTIFLRRGRLQLARKRYGLALKDLRRALKFGPSKEARGFGLQIVQELKGRGLRKAAMKALQELARLFPSDEEVLRILAQTPGEADFPGAGTMASSAPPPRDCELTRLIKGFQRAVRLYDYEEAGRIGESVLDKTRRLEHLQALSVPFLPEHDGAPLSPKGEGSLRRALRKLDGYMSRRPGSPWGYYIRNQWRAALHEAQDEGDIRRLMGFPSSRYGWMRALAAHHLLSRRRFRTAIKQFEAARDFSQPPDWRCQCHIAEALVCQGDLSAALRAFRKAQRWAGQDLGEVMAWKAEVLLWAGRYGAALRILEAIPKKADAPYALCWKGAALSKLGRLRPALSALDAAISRFPQDCEARVWRAETLLKAGRAREAAREAQAALACAQGRGNYFASAVRGLARAAQGNGRGLHEDFRSIPSEVIRSARRRLGLRRPGKRDWTRILGQVLELGRGNRRMDVPILIEGRP